MGRGIAGLLAVATVLSGAVASGAELLVCYPTAQNQRSGKFVSLFEVVPFGRSGATLVIYGTHGRSPAGIQPRPSTIRLDRFTQWRKQKNLVQFFGTTSTARATLHVAFRVNPYGPTTGVGDITIDRMSYPVRCTFR